MVMRYCLSPHPTLPLPVYNSKWPTEDLLHCFCCNAILHSMHIVSFPDSTPQLLFFLSACLFCKEKTSGVEPGNETTCNLIHVPRPPAQALSRSRGEKPNFSPRLRDKAWAVGLGMRLATCTLEGEGYEGRQLGSSRRGCV